VRLLQLGPGFSAQLVDQDPAGRLVGGQRLALTPAPLQRQHQQCMQVLAQRVRGGEPVQFDDRVGVVAQLHLRLQAGFPRLQADLLQVRHGPLRQQVRTGVGERLTAPQQQRRRRLRRRLLPQAVAGGRPRAGQRVLEPGHIKLTGLEAQHIAPATGSNPGPARLAQRLPQPLHVILHACPGRRRRIGSPQHLGQLTDRHQFAGVQQQRRQHRPGLAARYRRGQPIAAHHQRAEQAKL
jgi:hypothetical protein